LLIEHVTYTLQASFTSNPQISGEENTAPNLRMIYLAAPFIIAYGILGLFICAIANCFGLGDWASWKVFGI
jgi:hypothetical protein